MNHPHSSSSSSSSSSSASSRISMVLLLVITVFTSSIVLVSSGRPSSYANKADYYADGGDFDELLMMERFHAWMAAHGRSYPTAEEKLRRFHIYRDNVEFIEATNRDSNKTFTCGENQFTDLTHQEFLAGYTTAGLYYSVPVNNLSSPVITTRAGDITEGDSSGTTTMQVEQVEALPEHVDWRKENAVTPIQDQGNGCHACWVFASVATIESAHKIKTSSSQGKLLKLSEKEIVDCSSQHCSGGYPEYAFNWVKKNGIATESDYGDRYTPVAGSCHASKVLPAVTIKGVAGYDLENSEEKLAAKVAQQPVAVLFDSTDRAFKSYKNGIYSSSSKGHYNLDHAMAIVGYGEHKTTGQKYWIAKNSWGTTWGDGGYVYIQKDKPNDPQGVAGLAISPRYPVV